MAIRILTVVEFMKANLHRKLTLDEIAPSAGLSCSRVGHLFKSEFGMPPGKYLKMLRVEKARELLENTSLRVKVIMAQVGIQDQSHFTKDFKKVYGVTPSEYRERLAGEKSSRQENSRNSQ